MARHITELNIRNYRGIVDLEIKNLNDINILVGKNNCGKTSVLEAVEILSRPSDFNNIVMIARQRERFRMMPLRFFQDQYNTFINIFNKNCQELKVSLSGIIQGKKIDMILSGSIEKTLLSAEEIKKINENRTGSIAVDEEINSFVGTLAINSEEDSRNDFDINYNKYSKVMRSNSNLKNINVEFLSTIDHIVSNTFSSIVRDKEFTQEVVSLLQIFDKDILDLRILEDEDGRTYQAIDNKKIGYMPISTYGDGIKKVIALAGAIRNSKNGVLLIDEIETAIHSSAMKDVFAFIIKACREREVQLIFTTHSTETLDNILNCDKEELSNIRIITLYKNQDKTVARNLDGKKALEVKDELGLELK